MRKKDRDRKNKEHLKPQKDEEILWMDMDEDVDEESEACDMSDDEYVDEEDDVEEESNGIYEEDFEEEYEDSESDDIDSEEDDDAEYEENEDVEYEEDEEEEFEEAEVRPISKRMKKQSGKKTNSEKTNKKLRKKGKKGVNWKTVGIVSGIVIGILAAAYIGISVFFMSHFYINTEINGHKFSAKSAADVEKFMKEQVKEYKLTVLEKDNKSDTISGGDISLEYKENDDIKKALKKQNAFLWPMAFFEKSSTEVSVDVAYDENALNDKIENLQAVKAEQIPPVNAQPKYDGTQYVVEPEVLGTAVEKDVLREKIHEYIAEFKPELNMEEEGCYALPKYTADSDEVKKACDDMNRYLKASITYTMDENVVVDRELISGWLTVDENMKVTFNENGVREWLTAFGDKYDTMGGTRTITSPWGKTASVSGGDYGWSIDEETEFAALTNSIKNGEVITKEPAYYNGGRAASHGPQDWGNTYLEVDLSAQHMWFIVDGAVAMETDVVTGVPIPERETTQGVWFVKEMLQNTTLVGNILPETGKPEYETPVSYWMRITWSGIGFHDATWQPAFGGTLYADGLGSHGCINMPYDQAATLYNMLPMGTPAIVHY